ncbi:MAG: type II toxin-antitoxin system PemK/MazF family toxin [Herpetosiphon sp.]
MVMEQGDLFWIEFDDPIGSSSSYKHPHVVIQNNVFNSSRINTTVVCALTSNLKRATAPGNLLLEAGEGNLPKPSVVVVTQIITVDKTELGAYIGRLSSSRVRQILKGIDLVLQPRDIPK